MNPPLRIYDYCIESDSLPSLLALKVKKRIEEGCWQPSGSPFVVEGKVCQAMVLPNSPGYFKMVANDNAADFTSDLKGYLEMGWELHGPPMQFEEWKYQAVIRYEHPDPSARPKAPDKSAQ